MLIYPQGYFKQRNFRFLALPLCKTACCKFKFWRVRGRFSAQRLSFLRLVNMRMMGSTTTIATAPIHKLLQIGFSIRIPSSPFVIYKARRRLCSIMSPSVGAEVQLIMRARNTLTRQIRGRMGWALPCRTSWFGQSAIGTNGPIWSF